MSAATSTDTAVIPRGSTLGMLGGGQLGQMMIHAAHDLGYRVHVYCATPGEPATQVADQVTIADYCDVESLEQFARSVSAISYEWENVPAITAETCARFCPVRPGQKVLHTCQDRLREKSFFKQADIPSGKWCAIKQTEDIEQAIAECGLPAVLKTAGGGYDGKGQRIIREGGVQAVEQAWNELDNTPCILEAFVPFAQEVSVIVARGINGETITYGPIANSHRDHILDLSVVPSGVAENHAKEARDMATRAMQALDGVGVLCLELFQMADGTHLANEMAPRPHNSGHLTIDAYDHSQFHQQVLTMTGHPPAAPVLKSPAAMANVLGDLWQCNTPDFDKAAQAEGVFVHLYGKPEARPARKMGHITALAPTPFEAVRAAIEARMIADSRV